MSRLEFVRLPEGRLWHVAVGGETQCGRGIHQVGDMRDGRLPEILDGHVPSGAWVCRRCRDELAEQLHAVDLAVRADPRGRRLPQDRLPDATAVAPQPWWSEGAVWSASAIWRQLDAETGGRPFTEAMYVSWIEREYLRPWGGRACCGHELEAAPR